MAVGTGMRPMRLRDWVGAAVFNAAFYVWLAGMGMLMLPVLAFPRRVLWASVELMARGVMVLSRLLVGLDYRVLHGDRRPEGPVIIAAKHQSAWDTIVFLLLERHPVYIIKRELLFLPIYGWFAWRYGVVAVDRKAGGRALVGMAKAARERIAENRSLVIFPEGTRTEPGAPPAYHPGVFALYRDSGVPVVPVAIDSGSFWGRRSFLKYPGTITLEYLEPIPPGLDRKTFMARLESAIEGAMARLQPVDSSVE